jgi:hypothetical protein
MAKRSAPLVLLSVEKDVKRQVAPVTPSRLGTRALLRLTGIAAAALLTVVGLAPTPAAATVAAPTPGPPPVADSSTDPDPIDFEGGTDEMRQQLDETQSAWLDAKAALDASVTHQQQLTKTLADVEVKMGVQVAELGKVANLAFISAGYVSVAGIVSNATTDELLDGMGLVDAVASHRTNLINDLVATETQARQTQAGIDQEAANQQSLLAEMDTRKQEAQLALCRAAVGTCDTSDDGVFSARSSVVAAAAPRNKDGSWPVESRSVLESSVAHNGRDFLITPRTAHAVTEAKKAGFKIYVACYGQRANVSEHPKGRACDFAVDSSCIYCGAATGAARTYGDDLANFFVFNADRLGVLYVIWYKRIWLASTGRWKAYSGANGDPSSNHTNHVHLSIK